MSRNKHADCLTSGRSKWRRRTKNTIDKLSCAASRAESISRTFIVNLIKNTGLVPAVTSLGPTRYHIGWDCKKKRLSVSCAVGRALVGTSGGSFPN